MKTCTPNNLFLRPMLIAAVGFLLAGGMTAQTFTTLHNFSGGSDGSNPFGLILSGETLYGITSGDGTVFKIGVDGTGFATLHNFTPRSTSPPNTNSDGNGPSGLVLSGNTLYGTALTGSSLGYGNIFAINADGTDFASIFTLKGGSNAYPRGLMLVGNVLYGTTTGNSRQGYYGTVFAVNTDGTNFITLHNFSDSDGYGPKAGLTLSGNTLYGFSYGTVFKVNTDGTGFTTLHSFTTGNSAWGNVILSSNTLYGVDEAGGSSGRGTVFTVNTDGSGFKTLHDFSGDFDGYPQPDLILSGSTLYGTALYGGSSGNGMVFAVNTDGSGFSNLHSFTGGTDGTGPYGLILSGDTLYGMASGGSLGNGTLFSILLLGTAPPPPPSFNFTVLQHFTFDNGSGLVLLSNTIYGTGRDNFLLGLEESDVFAINTDGDGFRILHSFTQGEGDYPKGGVILSGTTLYGTTYFGGDSRAGTVFAVNTDGTGFTNLHSFTFPDQNYFTNGDGAFPQAGLILSGNALLGTATEGGIGENGTVFAVNTNGSGFRILHSFTNDVLGIIPTNSEGGWPIAGLVLSSNTLFGTAWLSGDFGNGTVFSMNSDGTGFRTLHHFGMTFNYTNSIYTNSDGARPQAALIVSGKTLYGTASIGGDFGNGTVFAVNTDGTGFRTLHSFTGSSDGATPDALILSGNTLYGTAAGGTLGYGTVFALSTDGTGFRVLYSFTGGTDGAGPGGMILAGSTLYGTTYNTVFRLTLPGPPQLTIIPSGPYVILTWPTNFTRYALQSTTNLGSPIWTTNSLAPFVLHGQNTVTNPISGAQQFFRLSQ